MLKGNNPFAFVYKNNSSPPKLIVVSFVVFVPFNVSFSEETVPSISMLSKCVVSTILPSIFTLSLETEIGVESSSTFIVRSSSSSARCVFYICHYSRWYFICISAVMSPLIETASINPSKTLLPVTVLSSMLRVVV